MSSQVTNITMSSIVRRKLSVCMAQTKSGTTLGSAILVLISTCISTSHSYQCVMYLNPRFKRYVRSRRFVHQVYLDHLELVGSMSAMLLTPAHSFVPAAYVDVLEFSPLTGQPQSERGSALQIKDALLKLLRQAGNAEKVWHCSCATCR